MRASAAARQGGFQIEPFHDRATGDAVTAIVAGDLKGAFVSTALGAAQIKGGKMRALVTTAATRSPLLPEVPTFAVIGMARADAEKMVRAEAVRWAGVVKTTGFKAD